MEVNGKADHLCRCASQTETHRDVIRRQPAYSARAVMEREHQEQLERAEQRRALQSRMDSYRSGVFTPSGRPYESLPVVTLGEMRKQLNENRRNVAIAFLEPNR